MGRPAVAVASPWPVVPFMDVDPIPGNAGFGVFGADCGTAEASVALDMRSASVRAHPCSQLKILCEAYVQVNSGGSMN
jgi:hypothetical protein